MACGAFLAVALTAALGSAAAAFAAEIPPSGTLDLRSFADLRLAGEARGDRLGAAVARAGDVNGDGIDDLIVGAPRHDAGAKTNARAAWVVFGTGDRDAAPGPIPSARGFRIDGVAAFDSAGAEVAGVGDIDGDGRDDVLVGAPLADAGDRKDAGAAYVVLGRGDTTPVDLAAPGAAMLAVVGAARNDRLGTSVAALPDANGDGRAPARLDAAGLGGGGLPDRRRARPRGHIRRHAAGLERGRARTTAGRVQIVYARSGPASLELVELGDGGLRIDGQRAGDHAGVSIAAAGGVDGGRIRLRFRGADLHGVQRERVVTQITESRRRR